MAWEQGAPVKSLPWALGSLRPVHRRQPRCLAGERTGQRGERALWGESRVLAERPGRGEEGEGGHKVASFQVTWSRSRLGCPSASTFQPLIAKGEPAYCLFHI